MTDLTSFDPLQEATDIANFKFDQSSTQASNKPSNINYAAHAAVLTPSNNVESTFRSTIADLETPGNTVSSMAISQAVKQRQMQSTRDAFISFLSNPNIDPSLKQRAASGFLNQQAQATPITNIVSQEALSADNPSDNVESENVRVNVGAIVSKVNQHKASVQSLMNRSMASNDVDTSDKAIGFLGAIAPFVGNANLTNAINDYKERGYSAPGAFKTMALAGEARNDIKNALLKMPIDQRLSAMTDLAGAINSHKGIVLPDDNYFTKLEALNTFINEGTYSTWDRVVDDATSLLDMSIIGGPLAKVIGKGASTASKAGKVAEAVSTAEKVVEPVTPIKIVSEAPKAAEVTEEAFNPMAKAISDYNDGLTLQQATHYAGIIQSNKGWQQARDYLEQFKQAQIMTGEGRGFAGDTPDFFNIQSKANRDFVRSEVSPVSVSQNYKDTNPDKLRAVHELADIDETGEAAQAAYGTTNRAEAIINDLAPEIAPGDGSIKGKVSTPDQNIIMKNSVDPNVLEFVSDPGMIGYTREEKIKTRAMVVNDFKNAVGLHARNEMFNIEDTAKGVKINAIYGPKESGFETASDAANVAEFALRDYGITQDAITVLKRTGEDYKPINMAKIDQYGAGDYLVKVSHDYTINPADVTKAGAWSSLDVKHNLFDYIKPVTEGRGGSLQRHIIDAQSMLHPTITDSASVAVNKSVGLERILTNAGKQFSDGFASLDKTRRVKMESIIKSANENGINYGSNALKAQGFTDKEIDILSKWREVWDSNFYLENRDLAKTLSNRNYGMFIDKTSGSNLIARPVPKNKVGGITKVYDLNTGSIRNIMPHEIEDLYRNNGKLAELRTPIKSSNEAVSHIISKETPDSFIRTLTENDQVLAYRPGYYQVHYKDPKFIEKVIRDSNGKEIGRQVVATAATTRDAKLTAERLSAVSGEEHVWRGDVKGSIDRSHDSYWDQQVAIGRTAQRVRGQRLQDATSVITHAGHENILDPVESLMKSIRSISKRTNMRDFLDTVKERFITQYGEHLPTNEFKEPIFPNSRKDIGKPGVGFNHSVADARTTYEYIRYMEDGYINSIDDFYKASLNAIADTIGNLDSKIASKAEETIRGIASNSGPTGSIKGVAFQAYLALNPLRQRVIQGHQAIRLAGLFPKYVASGEIARDYRLLTYGLRDIKPSEGLLKSANMTMTDFNKMISDYKKSGLEYAVDSNNLIRGDLVRLADMTAYDKVKSIVGTPIRLSQKIGFDAGEELNIRTAWLAYRDNAVQTGKVLNAETMEKVTANARNFTYNMDMAGDMPYNRNALNTVLQFLQVPHKAMLQDFTNRSLSSSQKARMLAFDTIMWGTGGIISWPYINKALNSIEDPETRRLISNGFEEYVLNKLITLGTGERTQIDFSDLAPSNTAGIYQTLHEIWAGNGVGDVIASSPSGQLFAGNNPRITNAFKTAARYFNLIDDYQHPTDFNEVVNSFAKISSGWSNMLKANYALQAHKKLSATNQVIDTDVSSPEAIAQLFGFKTIREAQSQVVLSDSYNSSQKLDDDVKKWYKDFQMHLANTGMSEQQSENVVRAYSEAWRVWKDTPRARQIVSNLLRKDITERNDIIFQSAYRSMGLMKPDDSKALILNAPMPEDKRQTLLDIWNHIDEYKGTK